VLRIGEVSKKYGISNRTLRYWEQAGVVKSTRADNGYRFFDNENIARINQILLLRKIKMPISDIERIFIANDDKLAIEILADYLTSLKHTSAVYATLATIVEGLIANIGQSSSIEEIFEELEVKSQGIDYQYELAPWLHGRAASATCDQPQIQLSQKRSVNMEELKNVRIVELPPMTVASYQAESETPEADCAKVFDKFVLDNKLNKRSGHRSFGFNNPEPTEGNPVYGYELWVTIPENFDLPEPFVRKQFEGGLYASVSAQINEIGERWEALYNWVAASEKYECNAPARWLEEQVMDYETFTSAADNEKQLDLLYPVRRL